MLFDTENIYIYIFNTLILLHTKVYTKLYKNYTSIYKNYIQKYSYWAEHLK